MNWCKIESAAFLLLLFVAITFNMYATSESIYHGESLDAIFYMVVAVLMFQLVIVRHIWDTKQKAKIKSALMKQRITEFEAFVDSVLSESINGKQKEAAKEELSSEDQAQVGAECVHGSEAGQSSKAAARESRANQTGAM